MFSLKRFYCLLIMTVITISSIVAIEIAELREEIENMIIMETAKSNSRESKLISLQYIMDSLKRGGNNILVLHDTLKFLALEGIAYENIEDCVQNNFPDVRLEAVRLLGQLNIVEARITLIEVIKYENNPMVLHEAIISLLLYWGKLYENVEEINIIINAIEKIVNQN